MLGQLLKSRIRYYRNYIRYHFDRTTILMMAFIILMLILLTGRSPTDIGYSIEFLQHPDFPEQWSHFFVRFLLAFYLLAELFAFITLRSPSEWSVLAVLPIPRPAILSYFLLRHLSKTIVLILIALALFWIGAGGLLGHGIRSIGAALVFAVLQMSAFLQAYHWYNRHYPLWQRILRWLGPELLVWSILLLVIPFEDRVSMTIVPWLLGLGILAGLVAILLMIIYRSCIPERIDGIPQKPQHRTRVAWQSTGRVMMRNAYSAFVYRDFLYLWRQNRSFFLTLMVGVGVIFTICAFQKDDRSVAAVFLFTYGFFSFILINLLLKLFTHDIATNTLLRSLAIRPGMIWLARWLFTSVVLTLPILITGFMLIAKFGISQILVVTFMAALVVIPLVFSTLYCCAGFGLFPYVNFATIMLNLSLLFIILLWFFLPFGSILIVLLWIFWIPRSLRHLKKLEIL